MDLKLWQERFHDYLAIVRQWSLGTVDVYTRELKPFFRFLEARPGWTGLAGLTQKIMEEYRVHLFYATYRGRPLSLSTQNLRFCSVKAFARFLFRDNYLLLDIVQHIETPKRSKPLPRVILTEEETLRLLEAPDPSTPNGLRDRAAMEVFYGTGIRNSELRALKIENVDFDRKVLLIECGKGSKARVVPLGEEAEIWLGEYLYKGRPRMVRNASELHVFVGLTRGRSMNRQYMAKLVRTYAKKIGLEKIVTPHILRHSCATHMMRNGAGLRHLQALLGHASLDTTGIYTRVEVSDLAKVIRNCHPRERNQP